MERARRRFAERCREAGLDERRFIDVRDGEKATRTPGHQNPENWLAPDNPDLAGNYGIHPGPGRDQSATWLVKFDIDDYDRERDRSALDALPETLAVKSPHTDPASIPGSVVILCRSSSQRNEVIPGVSTPTRQPLAADGQCLQHGIGERLRR